MIITLVASNKAIAASELINATLRSDLVPIPVTLEFATKSTPELSKALVEGAEVMVGDTAVLLTIIKARPVDSQLIKDGRRMGGIACIAVLSGCQDLIKPTKSAVILKDTSFNSVMRACGAKVKFAQDLPLPEFICLKGQLPSVKIAKYLQQEAAVICLKNSKMAAIKIDELLRQKPIEKLDPSAVAWIDSTALTRLKKSSYVSVDADGSTVYGEDTTNHQSVRQVPRLDARQLKNLEKVLLLRGTMMRPLSFNLRAGETVEINQKNYVILTGAHRVDTGSSGGSSIMASRIWIASL